MNIFKQAAENKKNGLGYCSRNYKILWENTKVTWNYSAIEWGIRYTNKWQIFPIWNTSNNCQRSLMFGFWKLYFQIKYCRSTYFNQNRKLFLRKKLWKFYQLIS